MARRPTRASRGADRLGLARRDRARQRARGHRAGRWPAGSTRSLRSSSRCLWPDSGSLRGYSTEGRAVVKAALDLPAVLASDVAHAWALYAGSRLAGQSDLAEALKMLERCLELRRGLGNRVDIAATLSTLSLVRLQTGDVAAAEVGEREALQIFVELSATASARPSGCCTWGRSRSTVAISTRVGSSSSSACRSRATSSPWTPKAVRTSPGRNRRRRRRAGQGKPALQAFADRVQRRRRQARREANALWHLGQLDLLNHDLASARASSDRRCSRSTPLACAPNCSAASRDCAGLAGAENRLATHSSSAPSTRRASGSASAGRRRPRNAGRRGSPRCAGAARRQNSTRCAVRPAVADRRCAAPCAVGAGRTRRRLRGALKPQTAARGGGSINLIPASSAALTAARVGAQPDRPASSIA